MGFVLTVAAVPAGASGAVAANDSDVSSINPESLARTVTIYRDAYGMPHIDGPTDEAVLFGFGYCQAEDYFWQLEDSYVMGLGRYAELYGKQFLQKDHAEPCVRDSPDGRRRDFDNLDPAPKRSGTAFVGRHQLLSRHASGDEAAAAQADRALVPAGVRPRRHARAGGRPHARLRPARFPTTIREHKLEEEVREATGSNAWAISGSKTRSGNAMLLINPHQPYYGFGQFYEAHLRSGSGWNFTGASFFGTPLPVIGHNEYCGWGFTTNEPNVGSSWHETFDDPNEPLNYRYDDGYRKADRVDRHGQGQIAAAAHGNN